VGDVLIVDDGRLHGVLTDRDIVIRAVATGRDASATSVSEICSDNPAVVQPDTSAAEAVKALREGKVRRLPVVDGNGHPVGVVSIGDLARDRDPKSVLADISGAPPNR
jgi:CBS domain-containing protein